PAAPAPAAPPAPAASPATRTGSLHACPSSSLPLALQAFQPEALAQQTTRVVRHAPQPGFVRQAPLVLGGGFAGLRRLRLRPGALGGTFLQRPLHALALGGVGLALGPGVRGSCACFRRFLVLLTGGRPALALRRLVARVRLSALVAASLVLALALARLARRGLPAGRSLPLHRRKHGLPVRDGILHAGPAPQRLVVGGDRIAVAALLRERIAEVVGGVGVRQPTPCLGGRREVPGPVGLAAALHARMPLLVLAQPPATVCRMCRLPRQQQRTRQQ